MSQFGRWEWSSVRIISITYLEYITFHQGNTEIRERELLIQLPTANARAGLYTLRKPIQERSKNSISTILLVSVCCTDTIFKNKSAFLQYAINCYVRKTLVYWLHLHTFGFKFGWEPSSWHSPSERHCKLHDQAPKPTHTSSWQFCAQPRTEKWQWQWRWEKLRFRTAVHHQYWLSCPDAPRTQQCPVLQPGRVTAAAQHKSQGCNS